MSTDDKTAASIAEHLAVISRSLKELSAAVRWRLHQDDDRLRSLIVHYDGLVTKDQAAYAELQASSDKRHGGDETADLNAALQARRATMKARDDFERRNALLMRIMGAGGFPSAACD